MKKYPSYYPKFPEPTDAEWREGYKMRKGMLLDLLDKDWYRKVKRLTKEEDLKEWAIKA